MSWRPLIATMCGGRATALWTVNLNGVHLRHQAAPALEAGMVQAHWAIVSRLLARHATDAAEHTGEIV